jgi:Uma2 family endonuclease
MTTTKLVTAEEFLAMEPDGFRYDLIRGTLVRTALANFMHRRIASKLDRVLGNYADEHKLGIVCAAETGYVLARNPDVVLGPDVSFMRADRVPPESEQETFLPLAPDLAVEVISPSERRGRIATKVREYLDSGVRSLWLVNPRRRTVTVYGQDRVERVLSESEELDGGDVLPGFRIPVADIFR